MKIGFDNAKYLQMQSQHIRERIAQFDNKLYLEFGGKLFDDYHASRVLPGLHLKIFRVVKAFFHGMLLFLILQLHLRHVGGAAGRKVTQTLYSIAYDRLRRNYFLRASSCSRCSNSSSSSMSSFRNIRQKLMKSSRQESQMARLPMGASARLPRPAPSANRKMMAK